MLLGPTATGKTGLAMRLAEAFPLDVISVDSAMVYRGMDIGTAKPGPDELARCPHRLVDIADPAEPYSAGRFVEDARREAEAILAAGRIPFLVGGTFLYARALQRGIAELPPADDRVRAALEAEAAVFGWPALHRALARVDPEAAARIEPNDGQRIQRALEVHRLSGESLSRLQERVRGGAPDWRFLRLGLWPTDRRWLADRIERRFREMVAAGLVEEVAALKRRPGVHADLPAMRAVGYRQVWAHLEGRCDLEEAIRRGIAATRQLARRQLTWMRQDPGLLLIDVPDTALAGRAARILGRALGREAAPSVLESLGNTDGSRPPR